MTYTIKTYEKSAYAPLFRRKEPDAGKGPLPKTSAEDSTTAPPVNEFVPLSRSVSGAQDGEATDSDVAPVATSAIAELTSSQPPPPPKL